MPVRKHGPKPTAKRQGRPSAMKDARTISVTLPAAMVRQVEAQARRQRATRNEAVRRLLASGIRAEGGPLCTVCGKRYTGTEAT